MSSTRRIEHCFQHVRLRRDAIFRTDPQDRRVEIVKRLLLNRRRHLAGKTPRLTAWLITTQRPVFCTDISTVSISSGTRQRRSTTSALTPDCSSKRFAAFNASGTAGPYATSVMSLPARFTSATPSGTRYSSSGTGPFSLYNPCDSTNMMGLLSRIADFISPLAS